MSSSAKRLIAFMVVWALIAGAVSGAWAAELIGAAIGFLGWLLSLLLPDIDQSSD